MQVNHLFIVNPRAGKGVAANLAERIKDLFAHLTNKYPQTHYEVVQTQYRGHATEIARDYSARGTWRIYAVGGDGTLNEVLNGMADSDSSLACIPGGTGNDFIQSLAGDFKRMDILKDTILGDEVLIDVGMANEKYFLNVASVGFDAKVNYRAELYKGKPLITPLMAYFGGILSSLHDMHPTRVTLHQGGERREKELFLMAVCNGRTYGGGYQIAPEALINDGLFDVVEVAPISLKQIPFYLPRLRQGTHIGLPEINFFRTDRIQLSSDEEFLVNLDGETTFANDVDFRLRAKKIRMVLPRGVSQTMFALESK